ncbi:sensor histidine kinase [Psychrobacter sp. Sarcosine-02u-2]|jgi:two-component system OmpR family sensor kinase|uniref:histidine kinase n=2 Tax=Psychrobacter pacificensis TaxID=112002 RepID=A0A1G7ALQ2_9GAMM|nr:sensor histidine kinase [Psychrobacter sp. CCUG 69069]PKG84266.1 sensor histidine kinase [Psychrobacter sp. Sarcosine-02u-2]SDE15864.1 two-component system, OmpR family, sensor kinase [Psychrobacter pacificensis]
MFVALDGISAMPKFRKPFNSLQFQLIFWSVVSLLLLAIVAGGYGFWYSYNEINDFQDDNLKNTAALLEQSLNISGLNNNAAYSYSDEHARSNIHFDTDDDDGAITVDIVILSASLNNGVEDYQNVQSDDEHDYSEPIPLALVNSVPQGISDQNIDGHSWRTYRNDVKIESLDTDEEVALILRQQTDLQDDLAKASALQSFLPLIIGIALLLLLLPFIMWRMMKPVRQLHHEISARNENDLSPLSIGRLPSELLPLAESLNRLLAIVKISIERQQRFIADAAHELRSPLTAISLQLQRLQRISNDNVMSEGLDKLAIRLRRNQSLVEQLLTLARAGNINTELGTETTATNVKSIIEQVIGLLIPIADNKNIELTVDLQSSSKVKIDETSLLMLIKNLIQNAIIYTLDNGQVMVKLYQLEQNSGSLDKSALNAQYNFGSHVIQSGKLNDISKTLDNKLVLQIIDSGAGIDPSDYEKAFEPFIRLNQVISAADQFSDSKLNNSISASRSDSASKQSQEIEGTGLGLSIVKSICEQAGIDVFMKDSNSEILNLHDNRGLCITLIF